MEVTMEVYGRFRGNVRVETSATFRVVSPGNLHVDSLHGASVKLHGTPLRLYGGHLHETPLKLHGGHRRPWKY